MTITRANFQAYPFHLVSPSPWPLHTSSILFATTLSGVLTFHSFTGALRVYTLLISVVYSICLWFRYEINEARFLGDHTLAAQKVMNMKATLFVISEALFFLDTFWSFLTEANLIVFLTEFHLTVFLTEPYLFVGLRVFLFALIYVTHIALLYLTYKMLFPFLMLVITIYQTSLLIGRAINFIIYYMGSLVRRGINFLDNYFLTVTYLIDNYFLIVEPLKNVDRALFTFHLALFIMFTSELLIIYSFIVILRVLYNKYWFIVKYHITIIEISPTFHIIVVFFIWIITRSNDIILEEFFIYTNGLQPSGNLGGPSGGGPSGGGSNPPPNNTIIGASVNTNTNNESDSRMTLSGILNEPESIKGHFVARMLYSGEICITLKNLDSFSKEDAKASLETLRRGALSRSYVSEEIFQYPGKSNPVGSVLVLAGFEPTWTTEGKYYGVYIPNIFKYTDSFKTNGRNTVWVNAEGKVFVRGSPISQPRN